MKSSTKRPFTPCLARYITLLITLIASTAFAQIAPSVAEDLMRKSGLWKQLESVGPQLSAGWMAAPNQPGVTFTDEQRTRTARSAEQAFSASALQKIALGVIASDTPSANVAQLMGWYTSPLGQRLSKLEEVASAETDVAATMAKGNSKLKAISTDRRELLEKFLVAIRGAEAITDLMLNMSTAIAYGAAVAAEPNTTIPLAELRRTMMSQRPEMLKAMHSMFLVIAAATYESVSDDELQQYTVFLASPVGRNFQDVSLVATDRAVVLAATAWGQAIMDGTKTKKA
jgi:hypothetical protein